MTEPTAPWRHISTAKKDGTFYEAVWRDSRGDLNRCYLCWSDDCDDWMTPHGGLVWEPLYVRDLVPLPDGLDGFSHLKCRQMPPGEPVSVEPVIVPNDHDRIVRQCARAAEDVYVGESRGAIKARADIIAAIRRLLTTAAACPAPPEDVSP